MNQSFYTGAVGAYFQQQNMDIQSNNIANINTVGFKATRGRFSALLYTNIKAADSDTASTGKGGAIWNTDTDFGQGGGMDTGRPQDYMIDGEGFFAVVDLRSGEVSLTRNGAFTVSMMDRPTGEVGEDGTPVMETIMYLSDGQGRFVLSKTGYMIEIPEGEERIPQEVGVFDYYNYNGMEHLTGTRFQAIDKNGGLVPSDAQVKNYMLEASNVDLAEELTKVIEAQRAYQLALRMVTTSDEIETTINGLRT